MTPTKTTPQREEACCAKLREALEFYAAPIDGPVNSSDIDQDFYNFDDEGTALWTGGKRARAALANACTCSPKPEASQGDAREAVDVPAHEATRLCGLCLPDKPCNFAACPRDLAEQAAERYKKHRPSECEAQAFLSGVAWSQSQSGTFEEGVEAAAKVAEEKALNYETHPQRNNYDGKCVGAAGVACRLLAIDIRALRRPGGGGC